jgi:hypothetical protein
MKIIDLTHKRIENKIIDFGKVTAELIKNINIAKLEKIKTK